MSTQPGKCPFCSMDVPFGSTTCPNCGGAVQAVDGAGGQGYQPLAGFGGAPGAPPAAGYPPPVGGTPPPVYTPPTQFAPPPVAAAPRSKGGGVAVVIIIVAVVVVLLIGAVVAGVLVSMAARGSSGAGSRDAATPILLNVPAEGELTSFRENEWFRLDLASPAMVTISVSSDFDSYLELYRAGEISPFMEDDDSGNGLNAQITTYLAAGTYEVMVRPWSSGTGPYTLSVTSSGSDGALGGGGLGGGGLGGGGLGGGDYGGGGYGGGSGSPSPQTLSGMVSSASGPAPVQAGTACSIQITPETGVFNCRVRVNCGGQMVYGAGSAGYNRCTTIGSGPSQIVEAHDTGITVRDGDPRMDIQTSTRQLTVQDGEGSSTWTVTVSLNP